MKMKTSRREIWLHFTGPWYAKRLRAVNWKGWVLSVSPLALVGTLYCAGAWHLPMLTLYWLGALVFVVVYWMLILDHTQWD